jgi:hypothetical protein
MRKMKLSLRAIIQRKGRTIKTTQTKIRLVVVDPEKGRKYPDNFVCVLPAQFGFPSGVFEKLYGQRSREAAKGFLMEALAGELDADVRSEILRRIKAIDDQQNKKDNQKPLKS